MAEFIAEFKAFMQTQSQIYELKQEHISIAHDDHEEHLRELVDSIQKKIDSKKEELWYRPTASLTLYALSLCISGSFV